MTDETTAGTSGGAGVFGEIRWCAERTLLDRAERRRRPTDVVLAPEQLHRRNLKRAVAAGGRPRSSLRIRTPVDVARQVASAGDRPEPPTLDRVDRLRIVRELVDDAPGAVDRLRGVYGAPLTAHAESIEAGRAELALVTGHRPQRLDALRTVCSALDGVDRADAVDYVAGIEALADALRRRVDGHPGEASVFDAGRDLLLATDGSAWADAFDAVDRVTVAGISTLGTPLLDFLSALARTTDVTVDFHLRAGTGPRIARRLGPRLGDPSGPVSGQPTFDRRPTAERADAPVTEVATTTRQAEARAATAVVAGLLERGVPVSDVAVVARDVDAYERPLTRAAAVYGRHLSVWSQLPLQRTLPYRLVTTTAAGLAALAGDGELDSETLFAPLDCQFVLPDGRDAWPLDASAVASIRRAFDTGTPATLPTWRRRLAAAPLDEQHRSAVEAYLDWLARQPVRPGIEAVVDVLEPLVDAFEARVLPDRAAADTPEYGATARTARALQRVAGGDTDEHLLRETRAKYADWLDRHGVARSWETVLAVLEAIAAARPGRREHANAERIDVLDATDTWLRSYPYVVAVGLVDGVWPQRPYGSVPAPLRTAIADGASPAARQLGVRGAWTDARERDHFVDAVRTASAHLVVTRFTEDSDGVGYRRSGLLDGLSTATVTDDQYRRLVGPETVLPDPIRRTLADGTAVGR